MLGLDLARRPGLVHPAGTEYAAGLVGPTGDVYGIDFTHEQPDKTRRIATDPDPHMWSSAKAAWKHSPWPIRASTA